MGMERLLERLLKLLREKHLNRKIVCGVFVVRFGCMYFIRSKNISDSNVSSWNW